MLAYRKDIDGLRAVAVIPVIFFHFGVLPNGYLGVDVFFVISGFLITSIIFKERSANQFSIIDFYLRRIRRIIPLTTFICIVAIIPGFLLMLPDDLENLSQSVIATNFFGNNILQAITTKNYWAIENEYKPLMHTWSLGVEEQFYLFYPFIFLVFKKRIHLLITLTILTILSIYLFWGSEYDSARKFYYLPFRFYELSLGGIAAIALKDKTIAAKYSWLFIAMLTALFFIGNTLNNQTLLIATVISTVLVLKSDNEGNTLSRFILQNPAFIWIGKISFSLYLWHQLIIAYSRYAFLPEFNSSSIFLLILLMVALSFFSYFYVEQAFRNKKKTSVKKLLFFVFLGVAISSGIAFTIYNRAGIIKDIPELGYSRDKVVRGIHRAYSERIYKYDREFTNNEKINIFVVGSSYARDFANILLESRFSEIVDISYFHETGWRPLDTVQHQHRIKKADFIFVTPADTNYATKYDLDPSKLYRIGDKNFGYNTGIFYNYQGSDYCLQRTEMRKGYFERNEELKRQWGDHFIDLISPIIDKNGEVPVFSDDCKIISQDCTHLTEGGAKFYSKVLEQKLYNIFSSKFNIDSIDAN